MRLRPAQRKFSARLYERALRLHAILNAAVDDGLIATSPCRKIVRPTVEDRHIVPLPVDGVRSAAEVISPRMRALVLLSVGTGLRPGKALGVTVDRVNLLRREVTVDRQLVKNVGQPPALGPPKTASSRRLVPLPGFVVAALKTHLSKYPGNHNGLAFTGGNGEPLAPGLVAPRVAYGDHRVGAAA